MKKSRFALAGKASTGPAAIETGRAASEATLKPAVPMICLNDAGRAACKESA